MKDHGSRISEVRHPDIRHLKPIVVAVLMLMPGAPASAQDPLSLLFGMEAAYARVTSYTARFVRQELVRDILRPREEALLKYQRPGRIYLRWISGPPKGREILFVEGRDNNRMLVHEPGVLSLFSTIVMAPGHPRVLQESRHPVTDIGIGRLIELILDNVRRARGTGELSLLEQEVAGGDGRPERGLEVVLSRERSKHDDSYRLSLSVDAGSGLPVRATVYDWEDHPVADYAYLDLRINPELTARDFDPENPAYGFPRWRINR